MKTFLSQALAMLALVAGTAFAQSAPMRSAPAPAAQAPAPAAPTSDAEEPRDAIDRICLRETGTLIRARRGTASKERCPSQVYGRAWTQDDLRSTGAVDAAQALRMLDPSIH